MAKWKMSCSVVMARNDGLGWVSRLSSLLTFQSLANVVGQLLDVGHFLFELFFRSIVGLRGRQDRRMQAFDFIDQFTYFIDIGTQRIDVSKEIGHEPAVVFDIDRHVDAVGIAVLGILRLEQKVSSHASLDRVGHLRPARRAIDLSSLDAS